MIREPVTIQKPKASTLGSTRRDLFGQRDQARSGDWETHCSPFAEIRSRAATASTTGGGVQAVQTPFTVRLQWCAAHVAITADMRVLRHDGSILALIGPARDPDGNRKEILLDCVAGAI